MFKASFPRHARLGSVARRQLSTLSPLRSIRIQSLEQQQLSTARVSVRPSLLRTLVPRFYSSEAAAEQRNDSAPAAAVVGSQHITRFADLSQLGVHERLLSAITKGMKYEDMTEVQSLTINAALRGTDLYVHLEIIHLENGANCDSPTELRKPRLVPERLSLF